MTVHTINKDILTVDKGLICHQVNCFGATGGLAGKIAEKYPKVANSYRARCRNCDVPAWSLLGTNQLIWINDDLAVINMFGQYGFGSGRHTEYGALRNCIREAGQMAIDRDLDLYIPYMIGCGLGGGSWDIVEYMIKYVLSDIKYANKTTAYICKL